MLGIVSKPSPCSQCGSDPVHHKTTYFLSSLEPLLQPAIEPLSAALQNIFGSQRSRFNLHAICEFLERAGLGQFLHEPDEHNMLLTHVLWDEARRRGIVMREFRFLGLPRHLFFATIGDKTIMFEGVPLPPRGTCPWWMSNKAIIKRKLQKAGFPVARGGAAFRFAQAQKIFSEIQPPVIVKPAVGSASRHTTLHITDAAGIEKGFLIAKQIAPFAVIEEELAGPIYRATLVEGKLIATLRRDSPQVKGSGRNTVAELVEKANKHPKRQGPYFSHIKLTPASLEELRLQGLTPQSIPKRGKIVRLHPKINWGVGGTTTDVTDEVHPENVRLFEAVGRELQAPLIGIDFIIGDIARSWKEQERCGILECNNMPFFDNHHLPFEGEPHDVAGRIWDMIAKH